MYEFSRIYFFKSNLIHPKNGMWLFRLKSHENGCFAIKQDIRIIILLCVLASSDSNKIGIISICIKVQLLECNGL